MLTWKSDSCRERNAGGEDRTNEHRDTEIVGHVPYNLAPRKNSFYKFKTTKTKVPVRGTSSTLNLIG